MLRTTNQNFLFFFLISLTHTKTVQKSWKIVCNLSVQAILGYRDTYTKGTCFCRGKEEEFYILFFIIFLTRETKKVTIRSTFLRSYIVFQFYYCLELFFLPMREFKITLFQKSTKKKWIQVCSKCLYGNCPSWHFHFPKKVKIKKIWLWKCRNYLSNLVKTFSLREQLAIVNYFPENSSLLSLDQNINIIVIFCNYCFGWTLVLDFKFIILFSSCSNSEKFNYLALDSKIIYFKSNVGIEQIEIHYIKCFI
jgi:hypothetical protein